MLRTLSRLVLVNLKSEMQGQVHKYMHFLAVSIVTIGNYCDYAVSDLAFQPVAWIRSGGCGGYCSSLFSKDALDIPLKVKRK